MKKIDIHCHTSNRLLPDCAEPDASVMRIYQLMGKYSIKKTVVLASYFPHKGTGISNYRIHHWIDGIPGIIMFGSLDFEHYFYQGLNELTEMAEDGLIHGIKIYTCYQNIDISGDKLGRVLTLAYKYELPVMFHAGISYTAYRTEGKESFGNLHDAQTLEPVVKAWPDINFIFSHLSKPKFNEMGELAKKYSNVYADMSGLIDSKTNQDQVTDSIAAIRIFVNTCGPEKLLFGTDFPVQTHEDSIYFIEEAMKKYAKKDKKKVYYDNAVKLLNL